MTYIHGCSALVGTVYDFKYNGTNGTDGSAQSWTTPCTGKFKLQVWGAEGSTYVGNAYGGKGGYSIGTATFNKNTVLNIYVGGKGLSTGTIGSYVAGGFNGGGTSGRPANNNVSSGGGATDIRVSDTSLYSRIIVAGGGGGGGEDSRGDLSMQEYGGFGGGEIGGSSPKINCTSGAAGTGGSQFAGGMSGGVFGRGANSLVEGGTGGGGWYGGGACHGSQSVSTSSTTEDGDGAGGGSGWVYTMTAYSIWKTNNSSDANKYLLNSDYYLFDASTIGGNKSFASPTGSIETGHAGHGYARITIVE